MRMETRRQVAEIRTKAGEGSRIAFVSGKFNIVHPGHLRLFRFAAENADFLVVGIVPDDEVGVTIPAELRLDGLEAIAIVNHACLLASSVEDFVSELRPDIVVKGKEYEERENVEADALSAYGGQLMFSSGEVRFSSLELIRREYHERNQSLIQKPRDFPERHKFNFRDLRKRIDAFSGLRVLVVGDLIVDTYVNCDPLGMSQEDPTLVVTPIEQTTFLGGAGIVAAHARGLGASVNFLSVSGRDAQARFAQKALTSYGVEADILPDASRPTTHKTRYRARGKTLLRVNELRQHALDAQMSTRFIERAQTLLRETDILLFSDFNYGCLPQHVVDALTQAAAKAGVWMGADSQASSQIADISRFRGMNLITPTEREARLAMSDFDSGLSVLVEDLQHKSGAANIVVTLGSEGMLIYGRNGGGYMVDDLPALNFSPKDVAGAGDSLFATMSLSLRSGADIWSAAYLGALAAAQQVSRVGNTPMRHEDLARELVEA